MADALDLKLLIELAQSGEAPRSQTWKRALSPDEGVGPAFLQATTAGVTFGLSAFSSISALLMRNRSSTSGEDVTAQYTHTKESITFAADKIGWVTGPPDTITDDDSSFVTGGIVAPCHLRVTGASESANNATWLVQAVAAGTLTLAEAASVTADADDAGTPTFNVDIHNYVGLPPGGWHLAEDVYPGDDLVLTSDSGTPVVDIWVLGT